MKVNSCLQGMLGLLAKQLSVAIMCKRKLPQRCPAGQCNGAQLCGQYLAASSSILAGSLAFKIIVVTEEVGVALIRERQAQYSLGIMCCIAFGIRHLNKHSGALILCTTSCVNLFTHCTYCVCAAMIVHTASSVNLQ